MQIVESIEDHQLEASYINCKMRVVKLLTVAADLQNEKKAAVVDKKPIKRKDTKGRAKTDNINADLVTKEARAISK